MRVFDCSGGVRRREGQLNETGNTIAGVALHDGTTFILSAISQDGEQHYNEDHLKDLIPKTLPYDVALPTHQ